MRPEGSAAISEDILNRDLSKKEKTDLEIPKRYELEMRKNKKAWKFFQGLAPSYKKHFIHWITTAKREETRKRRLKEAIDLLEQGKKLGMK